MSKIKIILITLGIILLLSIGYVEARNYIQDAKRITIGVGKIGKPNFSALSDGIPITLTINNPTSHSQSISDLHGDIYLNTTEIGTFDRATKIDIPANSTISIDLIIVLSNVSIISSVIAAITNWTGSITISGKFSTLKSIVSIPFSINYQL